MAPAQMPERPTNLPWLAVVILPSMINQAQGEIGWLADFEKCMAAAILEERK
jgi:hypothetical protein